MKRPLTFVVDVGGNLDVALHHVHRHVVEVFVLLQGKLSSQLQAVPVLVHRVDHHGVVIIKLTGDKTMRHFQAKLKELTFFNYFDRKLYEKAAEFLHYGRFFQFENKSVFFLKIVF